MRLGIVVFGSAFVDIKGYPLAPFIPTGRNVGRVVQVHGGVSRNVAEDIANVELRPTFVSVLDESGMSDDVISKLQHHRVNTAYIRRAPNGLGTWLAVFDNSGDVAASISSRPDLSGITTILEEQGDEIISCADSIVVEFDMDHHQLRQIFSLAQKYGKKIYAVVSNMSIAMERRDLLQKTDCVVCNEQEAGMLFSEEMESLDDEGLKELLLTRISQAQISRMIVTRGEKGAVYAQADGQCGVCPARSVNVIDTTGAGDAFFAGVAIGLTYGKTLQEACEIGTRLSASVIATKESVCPRFLPQEFGLEPVPDPDELA